MMYMNLTQSKIQDEIKQEKVESEAFYQSSIKQSNDSNNNLLSLTFLTVILAIAISLYMRMQISIFESKLFEEKENFKITLHSIGDGVITTDVNRNVQILNGVAEELTGWKKEDASGKEFSKVFDITNAITGYKAKDPVDDVLLTDQICELANNTILTSKDGTKRHIADSAAPIKNLYGKTTGVVMVF